MRRRTLLAVGLAVVVAATLPAAQARIPAAERAARVQPGRAPSAAEVADFKRAVVASRAARGKHLKSKAAVTTMMLDENGAEAPSSEADPDTTLAVHQDGSITGAKSWYRESTGTRFWMTGRVYISHDTTATDWTPAFFSLCDAQKSNGQWVRVKCNHRMNRFQSNAYSDIGDTSPDVLNEVDGTTATCIDTTAMSGWRRDEGRSWYAARLYIYQVRFLDDACAHIHLSGIYAIGSRVCQLAYPFDPEPCWSDPVRTGIFLR